MKKAVVLINLGTPDTPDRRGVRTFLKTFLSDRRVVEITRWLWWPILYGIILPFRSPKVAKKYEPLWMAGDSPLRLFSTELAENLERQLDGKASVKLAMTYGQPALREILRQLKSEGFEKITFLPLFPQYSATTTAAALDVVMRHFLQERNIPEWNWVKDYHAHPQYIQALAEQVREHWVAQERGERLLISFHGIPKRNIERGDPYQQQCERTASLLAEVLELDANAWQITYQSRLGKAEWLQPYTDVTVEQLAKDGLKRLDIVAPSFATECLETLEELDTEAAEIFYENGGERFSYIPCLNSGDRHAKFLAALLEDYL